MERLHFLTTLSATTTRPPVSDALLSNTTGDSNTANGSGALYSNTAGGHNTANGAGALSEQHCRHWKHGHR